jgi:hypothetical protein
VPAVAQPVHIASITSPLLWSAYPYHRNTFGNVDSQARTGSPLQALADRRPALTWIDTARSSGIPRRRTIRFTIRWFLSYSACLSAVGRFLMPGF